MKKRQIPFILVMVLLLMSCGCSRNNQKGITPQEIVPQSQTNNSATTEEPSLVSIGPPIEEYYDPNQPKFKIQMVYVTTDPGLNYHRSSCRYLANGKIALGLEEAKEDGYTPCPLCKPPQ